MAFHLTKRWFRSAFKSPMLVHRGVRVYNVLHREGWPLDFHYSWATTRPDGFRCYPNETFDLRKLPDFFQRPNFADVAGTVDLDTFYEQKESDGNNIISAYIDSCIEHGDAPWTAFQHRHPDWRGLFWAVREDVKDQWRHWFPSEDDIAWRESLTYLGTHLKISRCLNGDFHLYLEGQHWSVELGKDYPNGISAKKIIADYQQFIRRTFKIDPNIKTWRILSLEADDCFTTEIASPALEEWASEFALTAGLQLHHIRTVDPCGDIYFAGVTPADVAKAGRFHAPQDGNT